MGFQHWHRMVRRRNGSRGMTSSYGIVDAPSFVGSSGLVNAIVEKPAAGTTPSTLAVVGRYILAPSVFDHLERVTPGSGGEIQLTDAIAAMIASGTDPVLAHRFTGTRFDCGSHLGLIEATIRFALDHEKLSVGARDAMERALSELGVRDDTAQVA